MDRHPRLPYQEDKRPRFFYGYTVVIAAFIIMVVVHAAMYSFGVFLKPMANEFGWTRAATSGAFSISLIVEAFLCLLTGRLTDKYGPRIVVTICLFLSGLAYILMSQIDAIWQIYLLYGLPIAIGLAGCFVPLMATISRWFTKKRALMSGIVVSGVAAGTMIGPPVTSQLIASYGWRTTYLVMGIVFLVSLLIASQFLRRDPGKVRHLPYGEDELKRKDSISQAGGFSVRQAIHTRQLWLLFAMYIVFGTSQMAIMIHIVPHTTDIGIHPITAANIMTVIGALSLAGRIMLGGLADRIGNKPTLIIGLVIVSFAVFWLQLAGELRMFYVFAALFGFGYGGEVALLSPVLAELFGLGALGTFVGMITGAYAFGCGVGPLLAGLIFDASGNYYSAFLVCGVLAVTSLILVLLLKPIQKKVLIRNT